MFNGVKMKDDTKVNIRRIIIGVIILLIALLLLVSVSVEINLIFEDYQILKEADLTFWQVLRIDLPEDIKNPIGTFGAFFSFWLIYIFGKFFSISLLLGIGLIGFFSVFLKDEKHIFWKTVFFVIFSFFFNLLLFIINEETIAQAGIVPLSVYNFFNSIFNSTGTAIISIVVIIACLLIIFEVENVKFFFFFLGRIVLNFFKLIFKKRKKKLPQIKKEKREKIKAGKKEISPQIEPFIEESERSPNIIDHASSENSDKERRVVKPIIPKRKLTQDRSEIPDEPTRFYEKPDVESFLNSIKTNKRDREEIEENIKIVSKILERKLAEFNVDAEVINVNIGPIITQYEIKPAPGVKVSKFHSLADDLALAIKAKSIRVQAPIPGRGLVGIEIPNINRDTIFLKDVMLSDQMKSADSILTIALGKDISGNPVVADLNIMP
ncbi:MAG TPA: hypothetical protein ENL20_00620, partial [Candidatus Cloacimonetes bacterium]|nr:hypothetical protein [Candidatus Cloacimonadota bacterium]